MWKETCHKGFDHRNGLKRHQLLIHQDKDKYECEQCSVKVHNLEALKKHKQTVHVENTQQNKTRKCVHFLPWRIQWQIKEIWFLSYNFWNNSQTDRSHSTESWKLCWPNQSHQTKNEVNQDRKNNEKWIEHNNFIHEEEIKYAEIKESDENFQRCQEAKNKELQKVEDVGQPVLGTRYVLTEKDNGDTKARFVVKGFQENN